MARKKASEKVRCPDFSLDEIKHAVSELKTDRYMDPTGLVREVFKTAGDGFLLSVLEIGNFIQRSKVIPLEWGDIWIKSSKKGKVHTMLLLTNCEVHTENIWTKN